MIAAIIDALLNNPLVQGAIGLVGGAFALWIAKRKGVREGEANMRRANEETARKHRKISDEIDAAVAGESDAEIDKDMEPWLRD